MSRATVQLSVQRHDTASGAPTFSDPYFTAPAIGGRPDAADAEWPDDLIADHG